MKLAIVGATGLVGKVMLQVLSAKKCTSLILVASEKSLGKKIIYNNKSHSVISLKSALDLVLLLLCFLLEEKLLLNGLQNLLKLELQ